jgi:hemoglobin-like flavoprotein
MKRKRWCILATMSIAPQHALVRDTLALIRPVSEATAALFYGRLFDLNPDLEALFKGDMTSQQHRFMTMLFTAVDQLDQPAQLVPTLRDLGQRHTAYGVELDDYHIAGEALDWTLDVVLGDGYTPAARRMGNDLPMDCRHDANRRTTLKAVHAHPPLSCEQHCDLKPYKWLKNAERATAFDNREKEVRSACYGMPGYHINHSKEHAMLTSTQIRLIRESFVLVAAIAEAVPTIFYARLFALDPILRPLFKHDMLDQGHKLVQMLAFVVANLDKPDMLLPAVQRLGERHTSYGVKTEHYASVGAALIWTLGQGLGEQFTPEVRAAWEAAYKLLADTMQSTMMVA